MPSLNFLNNSTILTTFTRIKKIRCIHSYNWLISRNRNNIHIININKFLFLCLSRTRHTRKLIIHSKQILERNRSKSLSFTININTLFSLYSLMKTLRKRPTFHKSTRKLVDNNNFTILYNIINVLTHKIICP